MTDSYPQKTEHITVKTGDIFVTRSRTLGSLLIRVATLSKWSHVGIAVNSVSVLEAVKVGGTTDGLCKEVQVIPIEKFVTNASAMRLYVRPDVLTPEQIQQLNSFVDSNKERCYTIFHAIFSVFIPLLKLCSFLFAIVPAINACVKAEPSMLRSLRFWLGPSLWLSFWFIFCYLCVLSHRSNWGVETIENLFRKNRLGRWLVDMKYQMFCSKLVVLAEKEIGGSLVPYLPTEWEAQPKHIAKACEKSGWK